MRSSVDRRACPGLAAGGAAGAAARMIEAPPRRRGRRPGLIEDGGPSEPNAQEARLADANAVWTACAEAPPPPDVVALLGEGSAEDLAPARDGSRAGQRMCAGPRAHRGGRHGRQDERGEAPELEGSGLG